MNTDSSQSTEDANTQAIPHVVPEGIESRDLVVPYDGIEESRLRNSRWHHLVLWCLGLALAAYMIVLPVASLFWESWQPAPSIQTIEGMTLAESIRVRAMQALTGLWFFMFGGAIGSFLNVVAYRMPRGESVVFRPSRCPKCGSRILGQDNIPILGWLKLKGRCRACHAPISARYPIVEAVAAGVFFLFFVVQLITGGANIPLRTPPTYAGIVWIIFYTKWQHVLLYLYHCLLASSLLTWALIDIDRQRVTTLAKWVTGLMFLLPAVFWPSLLPVPWWQMPSKGADLDWTQALVTCLLGGFSGLFLGSMIALLLRSRRLTNEDPLGESTSMEHLASAMACVGIVLGWQATVAIALIMLALRLLAGLGANWIGLSIAPWTTWLLVAFVVHHLTWKWTTDHLTWWPGPSADLIVWIVTAMNLILLSLINYLFVVDEPSRTEVLSEQ